MKRIKRMLRVYSGVYSGVYVSISSRISDVFASFKALVNECWLTLD